LSVPQANVFWNPVKVTKEDRHKLNGHRGCVVWFTGYSGAGKSTLAVALEQVLVQRFQIRSYVLDGDNIRQGLNNNLSFSDVDRKENIRRIGEVAKLFVDAGFLALTAVISPYREDRDAVRSSFDKDEFIEVYVKCPLEECERRDPKGLYRRARRGEIKDFTGISAPYDEPSAPELVLETDKYSIEQAIEKIIELLALKNIIETV